MFSEIAFRLQRYLQQPIIWAMADVIFRVAFLLANPLLFVFEKFFYWNSLCAPSIYLAYAVINGQFGLLAFIWPLANAVFWTVAYHNGLCMLFLHPKDHSEEEHLHLLMLLAKAIFFLGYAIMIAKYWKDLSQRNAPLEQEKSIEEVVHRQMKMYSQLSKETWFDVLAFVPRRQLGKIVPQIGNWQFAEMAQPFLHNYGRITLGNIEIFLPHADYGPNGQTLVVYPKCAKLNDDDDDPWRTYAYEHCLPDVPIPMPGNIKNFLSLNLSYLDSSAMGLLQEFHQNSLLENVNLDLLSTDISLPRCVYTFLKTLSHVMPLIDNNINSIQGNDISLIGNLYNADERTRQMLSMARILGISSNEHYRFLPQEIDLFNRWLYTPRTDGKPRVLILPYDSFYARSSNVLHFIDGTIKQEFATSKRPCSFFVRLFVRDTVEWHGDICMKNGETKEALVIKKVASHKVALDPGQEDQKMALISRYPSNSNKQWIEANEREVLEWDFHEQSRRIALKNPIKNAIDNVDWVDFSDHSWWPGH